MILSNSGVQLGTPSIDFAPGTLFRAYRKTTSRQAREDEQQQKSEFDDLYAAKSKLQSLEAASAQRKKSRLAAQEVQMARDKQTSGALEARRRNAKPTVASAPPRSPPHPDTRP